MQWFAVRSTPYHSQNMLYVGNWTRINNKPQWSPNKSTMIFIWKDAFKMLSAKWLPFYLVLNLLAQARTIVLNNQCVCFGWAGCTFAHSGNYSHAMHMMVSIPCAFTSWWWNFIRYLSEIFACMHWDTLRRLISISVIQSLDGSSWVRHEQYVLLYTRNFCGLVIDQACHDDVIKWKHFPRFWSFVRGIHRSPVNSTQKGQWRRTLMFYLIYVWINDWVHNREAGDLRRHRGHYDVVPMFPPNTGQKCRGSTFSLFSQSKQPRQL